MRTEIELRQRAIALHLQGWNKSEIARKVQRSRRWVQRWIQRYRSENPVVSLQDHSRAPRHRSWAYPERIKNMVLQIRKARACGKQAKYQYALVSAQAIYYELCELHVSPLPSPRTIHLWLQQAGQIAKHKARKGPNPTYPAARCVGRFLSCRATILDIKYGVWSHHFTCARGRRSIMPGYRVALESFCL